MRCMPYDFAKDLLAPDLRAVRLFDAEPSRPVDRCALTQHIDCAADRNSSDIQPCNCRFSAELDGFASWIHRHHQMCTPWALARVFAGGEGCKSGEELIGHGAY